MCRLRRRHRKAETAPLPFTVAAGKYRALLKTSQSLYHHGAPARIIYMLFALACPCLPFCDYNVIKVQHSPAKNCTLDLTAAVALVDIRH
jgi:hypothetical protein